MIAYLTSCALSVESPAQLLREVNCIHSLAVFGDGEDLRNETYFEDPWVELSWLFWGFGFVCLCVCPLCFYSVRESEPQISYMLEDPSTKGLGPQLLVQHFKIVSINSCFTYKNSNFIWLNILNKCSGPVLKVSRFSFLATITMRQKFSYRGSAVLLRSVPPSCFVSIWVFSRRCWTSGSFTTSIVCSSNNPKCQYLYHCH